MLAVAAHAQVFEHRARAKQRHAAADDNAFFDRCLRRVEGVLDQLLLLLHVGLGHRADADDRDAASDLGQALLQLLLVVVGGGLLDLRADAVGACLDLALLARTFDDGGGILGQADLAGRAQVLHLDAVELDAEVLAHERAAGEDRDVLHDRLAAITEARCLDGRDVENALQPVDDQGRQCLGLDVLGQNQQRLAGAAGLLEQRDEIARVRDLLFVDEDEGILEDGLHRLRVGDEVRGDVALVELHTLDHLQLGRGALALFDRDDALGTDLVDCVGQHVADLGVVVGRDGADLGDLVAPLDLLRGAVELSDDGGDGRLDAGAQLHRVDARREVALTVLEDRLGENRGRRGAVTGGRRWSCSRPLARAWRPCSRRGLRARSPWRR